MAPTDDGGRNLLGHPFRHLTGAESTSRLERGPRLATLRQLEDERLRGLGIGDASALEAMFAADMVYIDQRGRLCGRDEFLALLKNRQVPSADRATIDEERTTITSDAMLAVGACARSNHRQPGLRYTVLWVAHEDHWQVAMVQETPIARSAQARRGRSLPAHVDAARGERLPGRVPASGD